MSTTIVTDGFPVASAGDQKATLIAGSDGTNAQTVKVNSDGELVVNVEAGSTVTANQGTKTATATNGWLVTPTTSAGNEWATSPGTNAAQATGVQQIVPMLSTEGGTNVNIRSIANIGDAASGTQAAAVGLVLKSGTTFDRARGNEGGTLLASAARTTTTSSADQTNYNGQAVAVSFDITAVPGGDTVTISIEAKDPVSGTYTAVLTGAAQSGTGFFRLRVGTDITAAANLAAADVLGRTWRATVTHSGAGSFTYSLGVDTMTA